MGGKHLNYLLYAALIAAVCAAYANIYKNPFLYDDVVLIAENQSLRGWDYLKTIFSSPLPDGNSLTSSYYRPFQMLLYLLICKTVGLSQAAYHGLNVALHAANACLVYKLGQKLQFKRTASFFAALLWAVHPMQTEAVTYVSATADPLYALFCLAGMIVLLPEMTARRLLLALPVMACGLLSKEAAISFPLLAMCCVYCLDARRFDLKPYLRLWPLAVLGIAYVGLRYAVLPHRGGLPEATGQSNGFDFSTFAILPHYLGFMLAPNHLHMEHDLAVYPTIWRIEVLAGIALVLGSLWQVSRPQTARSRPFSWGLCWFAAAIIPTFSAEGVFYEHWLYLPSVGLFLGVAESLALSWEGLPSRYSGPVSKAAAALGLLAVLAAGIATYRQNRIWGDPIAFYQHTIARGEATPKMHVNLGVLYINQDRYAEAIEQNRLAIVNSHDTIAAAEANLAIAQILQSDDQPADEALAHLQRALVIDPGFYPALEGLALYYAKQGNTEEARLYQAKADQARIK